MLKYITVYLYYISIALQNIIIINVVTITLIYLYFCKSAY